jgi:hypothetical protein
LLLIGQLNLPSTMHEEEFIDIDDLANEELPPNWEDVILQEVVNGTTTDSKSQEDDEEDVAEDPPKVVSRSMCSRSMSDVLTYVKTQPSMPLHVITMARVLQCEIVQNAFKKQTTSDSYLK